MTQRIYAVMRKMPEENKEELHALVWAQTPSHAIRIVTEEIYGAHAAKQSDFVEAMHSEVEIFNKPNGHDQAEESA